MQGSGTKTTSATKRQRPDRDDRTEMIMKPTVTTARRQWQRQRGDDPDGKGKEDLAAEQLQMSQQMDVGLPQGLPTLLCHGQQGGRISNPKSNPVTTSPHPTPGLSDDDNASPRKRQRQELGASDDESPIDDPDDALDLIDDKFWKKKGMILGHCVEMWDRFYVMIDEAVSRNPAVDEDDVHTDSLNLQYKKYCLLTEIAPEMSKLVRRVGECAGPQFSVSLDIIIDMGRKQAHRADVNGIRSSVGLWPCIDWEPRFLVHVTSWDSTTLRLVSFCVLSHLIGTMPTFASNFAVAYKHVFISPSSAKVANRSMRRGNAALHNITSVTFESVAYVATLVRFALSNEPTFVPGGQDPVTGQQNGFPYCDFYRELLVHKGFLDVEEELEGLLQWWNKQFFPRSVYHNSAVNSHSIGAIMRERAKAKCAAREATNEAA
ncbi:hypothetical protein EDB84DRAFT_1571192 [Lactarius hengduanensis]|nr:hypothetical protein EDB84DRAFT_1571192 [Lactarius hengduanensis]